ncbi:hypothetical protein D9613_006666 [Agrocybe pediades]|uniref:Uncharacterized protein n=1 Tax=Agrocybe pediades TaxID=84607 RepID=A0A8H4VI09_9AGAR|nr:hypothetical protein D9613_006666 [Agrocybe pediades]
MIQGRDKAEGRPRRNTVAVASLVASGDIKPPTQDDQSDKSSSADAESLAKFPLAREKRRFKFKHMVHKLYERKEDWAKLINEVVRNSKNEFRPLAECQNIAPTNLKTKEDTKDQQKMSKNTNTILLKDTTNKGGERRPNATAIRRRSVSVVGGSKNPPVSPTLRSPIAGTFAEAQTRVVKKRCIGRRKSMSGAMDERGNWVYEAAVSSVDVESPTAPAPSSLLTSDWELGLSKYGELGSRGIPNGKDRAIGAMRKRAISTNLKDLTVPAMMPLHQVSNINKQGLAARRRRVLFDTMNQKDEPLRRPEKRPFAA